MLKSEWKKIIEDACVKAGTYKPFYDPVIDILAALMERRDNAEEKFEQSGGQTIVKHTNKAGAVNIVKNPALAVVTDLERDALAYWRDLGLTPAGYKRLNADVVQEEKKSLEALLEKIT